MNYKLIKEYPGSPKLGYISKPHVDAPDNAHYWDHIWFKPEDYPEFWEEIKEKKYKIVSFRNPKNERMYIGKGFADQWYIWDSKTQRNNHRSEDWMIRNGYIVESIKRLSDGEVFSVGDKINFNIHCDSKDYPVDKIATIKQSGDDLIFSNNNENWGSYLYMIKHYKEPLFTTEDGVDIFEGDKFWFVIKSTGITSGFLRATTDSGKSTDLIYFSTLEKAQDYLKNNKPRFSEEDIKDSIAYLGAAYNSWYWRDFSKRLIKNLNEIRPL